MDLLKIYLVYNLVRRKIMKVTAVTFDENRKYNLGITEKYQPRKQMKTEVVSNKDIIILTKEKEEKQNSFTIPITIA